MGVHVFGDSCEDVLSAEVFLGRKVKMERGYSTNVAPVFDKVRVAPMKASTTSKLELQTAILSARLWERGETRVNC